LNLIDRYISGRILKIFILGQIAFISLFIFVDVFVNFGKIQDSSDAPIYFTIVKYYSLFIPTLINMSSNFIFCLSCFFALAQLERNSQLIAIHASGISIYRVITLLLSLSLLFGVIQIINNSILIPKTSKIQIDNNWSQIKLDKNNPINFKEPNVKWEGINKPIQYNEGPAQINISGINLREKTYTSLHAILMDHKSIPVLKIAGSEGSWDDSNKFVIKNVKIFSYEMNKPLAVFSELTFNTSIPLKHFYYSRYSKQCLSYSELSYFKHLIDFRNEKFHRIADGLLPFLMILLCSVIALPLIYIKPIFAYLACLGTTLTSFLSYTILKGAFEHENLGYIYPLTILSLVSLSFFVIGSKKIPS